jgi:hypothetical protein
VKLTGPEVVNVVGHPSTVAVSLYVPLHVPLTSAVVDVPARVRVPPESSVLKVAVDDEVSVIVATLPGSSEKLPVRVDPLTEPLNEAVRVPG